MALHTGGVIALLLRNPPSASCTTITITDSATTPSNIVKVSSVYHMQFLLYLHNISLCVRD